MFLSGKNSCCLNMSRP